MQPKTIQKLINEGKTVTYTVRRLRGYLHGDASLVFYKNNNLHNIERELRNFRFDEKPYDQPRWTVK